MENMGIGYFSEFYKDKRIFLTGHTGFKGSWLLTWLTSLGANVKGYALDSENDRSLFNIIKDKIPFDSVIADIRDKAKLKQEIIDFEPDVIFHLAAQPLVRRSYQIPTETFETNAIGTANLLESLIELKRKCTVVCITTDKVYENKEEAYHYKEEDRLGGYDPYSASKAATEIVISSFRNSFFNQANYNIHQKAILSARAGNVIGGGDWSCDRIIPDIIRSLENDMPINIRSPKAVRPWQHVLEPINGYMRLASAAYNDIDKVSESYNFGPNPKGHLKVESVVEKAINCWGSGHWVDVSNSHQPHEAGLLMLSIERAKAELGWHPFLDVGTAIEWTVNWYKKENNQLEYTLSQIAEYQKRL